MPSKLELGTNLNLLILQTDALTNRPVIVKEITRVDFFSHLSLLTNPYGIILIISNSRKRESVRFDRLLRYPYHQTSSKD